MSYQTAILRSIDEIAPLSTTATEILRAVSDPEFEKSTLVHLVSCDPGLTAKILGLCNSSLFGLKIPVTTIADAIGLLGVANLTKLVVSSCLSPYFTDGDAGYLSADGSIWRHSVACAITAQIIARRGGAANPGTAFTAGIMHNIGKIAIGQFLGGMTRRPPVVGEVQDYLSLERSMMGIDHCVAGGIILRNWGVPDELPLVCEFHHDESQASAIGALVAVVHVADQLIVGPGFSRNIEDSQGHLSDSILDVVGIDRDQVGGILTELHEEFAKSQELVKLN